MRNGLVLVEVSKSQSAVIHFLLIHNRDKPSLEVFHIHMVLNTTCLAPWPERPC